MKDKLCPVLSVGGLDSQRFWEVLLSRTLSSFTFFFCTCFFSSPPSCSFLAEAATQTDRRGGGEGPSGGGVVEVM